jgi:hypothetical protein
MKTSAYKSPCAMLLDTPCEVAWLACAEGRGGECSDKATLPRQF